MSNIERRNRIEQLKERLFFEIKDQNLGGGGGGGGSYGAPDIPSYNAPTQKPPSYNAPSRPSYNVQQQQPPKPSYNAQPPKPSYGAPPSYGGGGKGGKIIEIPIPDLPIPDPIQFKAGVLRSKGRIASGLLHTKAGILRAGANILAQKANALDKFAQAIPAIKANLINVMTGFGDGGGGGGYGAPPSNTYGAPPPQTGYNQPTSNQQPPPVGPTQQQSTYNSGNNQQQGSFNSGNNQQQGSFNSGNNNNQQQSTYNSGNNQQQGNFNSGNNNFQTNIKQQLPPSSNNFRPSNQDGYGSPQSDVITGTGITSITSPRDLGNIDVSNVQVGSSLTFGNNNNGNNFNSNSFNSVPASNSVDSFRNGNGFNPLNALVSSTLDQATNGKRNVVPSSTLNNLNAFRNTEKLVLQETRGQQVSYGRPGE